MEPALLFLIFPVILLAIHLLDRWHDRKCQRAAQREYEVLRRLYRPPPPRR